MEKEQGANGCMNETPTCTESDAQMAQDAAPGSLDVHALLSVIGALTEMRTRYGAESPIGYHCTNLIEQLGILPDYVRPEWATHEWQTLPYLIKQQIAGLARLTAA